MACAAMAGQLAFPRSLPRSLLPVCLMEIFSFAWCCRIAHSLGFDKVRGRLVADPRIQAHIITIDVTSPAGSDGQAFKVSKRAFFGQGQISSPDILTKIAPFVYNNQVSTVRFNPAAAGAVTGNATYVRCWAMETFPFHKMLNSFPSQASFLSSLLLAHGRGGGIHFC